MKIIHLNYSDIQGGAARAAYRIHQALLLANIDSQVAVNYKLSDDWRVMGPKSALGRMENGLRPYGGAMLGRLLKTGNRILHSPSVLPSRWLGRIKKLRPDVIHLHWVCGEMLSIAEIGRLQKPVVWTLHDMWAFCGAEHCTEDYRWREGYNRSNRPSYESAFDLNRWTWARKRKYWKRPYHIVTPSHWLKRCVQESALMHNWPVAVIPNSINTEIWAPVERFLARRLLALPLDVPLVLFGAMSGSQSHIKGLDLLRDALKHLHGTLPDLQIAIFGQNAPQEHEDIDYPVHYLGHLYDNLTLRILYSAADVMVIPSRLDNLPNTGLESLSCGTPVVAFDTCGLPDIVCHMKNGYLARPFDTEDLAAGIQWVLADSSRHDELSSNARAAAVTRFSEDVVIPQYLEVYKKAIMAGTA